MSKSVFPVVFGLLVTETHMRRWLVGGLRSEVSEANETKQVTHQPLTAICDVTAIFLSIVRYYFAVLHFDYSV